MKDDTGGPNERKHKPMTLAELIADIDLRFTSGNSEPVSRAAIRPDEWAMLKNAINSRA